MNRRELVLVCCVILFSGSSGSIFSGCGSSSSPGSSTFSAPAIAPIVQKALPSGLRATGGAALFQTRDLNAPIHILSEPDNNTGGLSNAAVAGFIQAMFTEYFINAINGSTYQGYLNSLISGIDARMAGINTMVSTMGKTPTCLSSAVTSSVFNLGVIDPMLNFTVPYLQCSSTFGAPAQAGSGMDFGTDGNGNYSLWMQFSNAFYAVANVLNYGSTSASAPETVDGVMFSAGGVAARFIASPSLNSFALFLGANQAITSGGSTAAAALSSNNDSYLGLKLRIVSDGVHVFADGYALNSQSSSTITGFNICLVASTMAVDATASDCATLATTYVTSTWANLYPGLSTNPNPLATSATLSFNEVTGCSSVTPASVDGATVTGSNPSSSACPVNLPVPVSVSNLTAPLSAISTAVTALTLPAVTSLSN